MTEEATTAPERLPVSVITGFLGSGKTTLLRHLLNQPEMSETAVVINEFGEVGLDHLLVESSNEDTVLMSSGCLCCTIRGDLIDTLRRLYKRRDRGEIMKYKRLVIETTGLADPAPILHTLMGDPLLSAFYKLDGVIATVDAVNGMMQFDHQMESVKQAAVADRLLLTKCDLANNTDELESRLRKLNPAAPIHHISYGQIDPALLFNIGLYNAETKSADVQQWLRDEAYLAAEAGAHHDHGSHGNHDHHDDQHRHDVNRHDDRIRAFCLVREQPLDWDRFVNWVEMLTTLHGANLLRVKGILNIEGGDRPIAIHGVQHLFHPPAELPSWQSEDRRSKIVVIARDLDKGFFERSLSEFVGPA